MKCLLTRSTCLEEGEAIAPVLQSCPVCEAKLVIERIVRAMAADGTEKVRCSWRNPRLQY